MTTIAPTGTISIIAGCSSGIEPIFGLYFKHRLGFEFFNPFFEQVMKEEGYWSETLKEHVRKHGTIGGTNLPQKLKNLFRTAHEIPPEWPNCLEVEEYGLPSYTGMRRPVLESEKCESSVI